MAQRFYSDYLRPYLVLGINGEDFPMLIKLESDKESAATNELIHIWFVNGKAKVEFVTGYLEPVETIDGLRCTHHKVDFYGRTHAHLEVDTKKVSGITVKHYAEGCDYINAMRYYYTQKYGVKYERE